MKWTGVLLFAVAVATAVPIAAQGAKEVRGASPYLEIKNEPPPKLIVMLRCPTCSIKASCGSNGASRT